MALAYGFTLALEATWRHTARFSVKVSFHCLHFPFIITGSATTSLVGTSFFSQKRTHAHSWKLYIHDKVTENNTQQQNIHIHSNANNAVNGQKSMIMCQIPSPPPVCTMLSFWMQSSDMAWGRVHSPWCNDDTLLACTVWRENRGLIKPCNHQKH